MQKTLNVLVIENQPMVMTTFRKALWYISNTFNVKEANNYNQAKNVLVEHTEHHPLDIVLLNMDIPIVNSEDPVFIDDLVELLRSTCPEVKIIALTLKSNSYKLNTIFKSINPEGVLINTEVDINELVKAIKTVMEEPPYYSKLILRFLKKRVAHDIGLDKIDRVLLHYLSQGAKTKDLPRLLNMSASSIERRKKLLKDLFNISYNSDYDLLRVAREKGFV